MVFFCDQTHRYAFKQVKDGTRLTSGGWFVGDEI